MRSVEGVMSNNRCPECGQMMSADRDYLCESCAERQQLRQRVEQLEEELSESVPVEAVHADLRALRPKAALYDRIRELISLGLSPAQVLDVAFAHDGRMSHRAWSNQRGVSPAAVYNNIADCLETVETQTQLGEHDSEQMPESIEE